MPGWDSSLSNLASLGGVMSRAIIRVVVVTLIVDLILFYIFIFTSVGATRGQRNVTPVSGLKIVLLSGNYSPNLE